MSIVTFRSKQKDPNNTVLQNGQWIQRLDKELTLEAGDQMSVTQCFIDTQQLSSEGIVITEDTAVGFDVMFFETNHDFTDKTAIQGGNSPDYEKYLVYHRDPSSGILTPVIRSKEINIPRGSYTPERLSGFITDELSSAVPLLDSNRLDTGNNLLIRTDDVGAGAATKLNNIEWGNSPYPYASITQLSGPPTSWGPDSGDGTPYYLGTGKYNKGWNPRAGGWVSLAPNVSSPVRWKNLSNAHMHITSTGSSGSGSGLVIAVYPQIVEAGGQREQTYVGWYGPNWNQTITPAGEGNRTKIYYTVIDGGNNYQIGDNVYFNSEQFGFLSPERDGDVRYTRCPTGGTLTLTVEAISADGSGYFEFIKVGEDPQNPTAAYRYNLDAPYYIGASEVDLEFDDNGNGAFSWNFLHTPIYKNQKNQPLQPAIALIKDSTSSQWSTVDVDSGVLITQLKPVSFWQDVLNFPSSIITLDDLGNMINNTDTNKISNIEGKYTKGYVGLNGYLNTNSQSQARKVPTSDLTISTTLTKPLQANEFATNTGAGHYIVMIEGFYNQQIITGQGVFQASAIVSKQYNNSDIVWSEGSGIAYSHLGEPITFDSYTVTILDPDTGLPATGLGNDNYIYSEIVKTLPQPVQSQKTK